MRDPLDARSLPIVSVVVPCRDEGDDIEVCLRSLLAADYPGDRMEVLVVDGGSQDGTLAAVERVRGGRPCVRVLRNPGAIAATGMNIGVRAARGEIVVIAGAHARYGPGYLRGCVEAIERSGADCVGGPIAAVGAREGVIPEAIALALCARFGVGNARFRVSSDEGDVDTVAYGAYRREVFDRVGLFDERLVRNQDIEFNARVRRAGGRIFLSPTIRSQYFARPGLAALARQSFENGRWNVYTLALTGLSLSWRHFVPMAFVGGFLGSCVAAAVSPAFAWLALGTGGLYLLAAAAAAALAARGVGSWAVRAVLPVVFAVHHMSYGLGSLWGLATLWRAWRRGR